MVRVAVPHRPVPKRHGLLGDQTDASGRTGADTRRLDTRRLDTGRVDASRPDAGPRTMNPGDWTPTGRAGHRTGRTAGPPDDGTGSVDTACWTRTGDRRHGWRRIVEHGDCACPMDARWTLGWADASGRSTNQDSSAARTRRGITLLGRGLATATTGSCSVASPARPRLGALLSSDDYGSSVERAGAGQVLWRAHLRAGAVVFSVVLDLHWLWTWTGLQCLPG